MQSLSYAEDLPSALPDLVPEARDSRRLIKAYPKELLPFTVRLVRSQEDLLKAVRVRYEAYARHLPEVANALKEPEAADWQSGSVILLAESKLDGSALGTMRIQTNQFSPLPLEQAVHLPPPLAGRSLAEANRLGVLDSRNSRLVKAILFKAFNEYCLAHRIEWMVIAARRPVDRLYEQMQFSDVFPGQPLVPLKYAGNIPHRIMSLHVPAVERLWDRVKYPLLDFLFRTVHPDIHIEEPRVSSLQ